MFLAVWVDDSLLVGDSKAIDKAIQDLKDEGFVLKEDGMQGALMTISLAR